MAAVAVEAPVRKSLQVSRVAEGRQTQGASAESRQRPDQETAAAQARDIVALRREMERRALPAGPPPAFRMNLLEAEGGIDRMLARIEAERCQQRDAPALRLATPGAAARDPAGASAALPDPSPDRATAADTARNAEADPASG